MTIVVNVRKTPCDVYIGRGSPFGNPFIIGKDGTREEVIEKYEKYFYEKIVEDDHFLQQVISLYSKRIGCYCAPLACHGDIIKQYLERICGNE